MLCRGLHTIFNPNYKLFCITDNCKQISQLHSYITHPTSVLYFQRNILFWIWIVSIILSLDIINIITIIDIVINLKNFNFCQVWFLAEQLNSTIVQIQKQSLQHSWQWFSIFLIKTLIYQFLKLVLTNLCFVFSWNFKFGLFLWLHICWTCHGEDWKKEISALCH